MGAVLAVASAILSMIGSSWAKDDAEEKAEEQRTVRAATDYASAVRNIQLTRERRDLEQKLIKDKESKTEEIMDLQESLVLAAENAELTKGVSGPIVKALPVEKILVPAIIGIVLTQVFKK